MSSFSTDPPARPRPGSRPGSPRRRFSLGAFTATLAATFAALTALSLALPVDPYIRFQSLDGTIFDHTRWIYERIHDDPAPIDVVFIGSSRTEASVYPTLLEPALAERGLDLRVANFSLPSSGFDIRDTLIEELFTEKQPRLLVFSVVEAFPRDGHDAFGDLASVGDLLRAPWLVNRDLAHNLLRLPVRQITYWLQTLAPQAFDRRASFDPARYAGSTIDLKAPLTDPAGLAALRTPEHAEALALAAAQRRRDLTPPLLPGSLSWVEFGVSQSYVEHIIALAQAHDTRVAFLFMPFYTGPTEPLERAWLEARGPLWRGTLLADNPHFYYDSGHPAPSEEVRGMLTEWMADNISALLAEDGAAPLGQGN